MGIEMEHGAVMNMIANRCRRVIVFVSQKLLLSRHALFIILLCQKLTIGDKNSWLTSVNNGKLKFAYLDERFRKIIPILMEDVDLPLSLKNTTAFKLFKCKSIANFYEILETSLKLAQATINLLWRFWRITNPKLMSVWWLLKDFKSIQTS